MISGMIVIFSACDIHMRICVGSGSFPPRLENIPAKTGTMNSSIPAVARIAMMNTTTG